jgi:Family of unknown function (DUF5522)
MKNKPEPLSREYLLRRKICCGCACENCPYDYESIPEPQRTKILNKRRMREINSLNDISKQHKS